MTAPSAEQSDEEAASKAFIVKFGEDSAMPSIECIRWMEGFLVGRQSSRQDREDAKRIPATLSHDEGAYAQCAYCKRYSDNPNSLARDEWPCDCGKLHGWSGSFKKPDAYAQWSKANPNAAIAAGKESGNE